MRELRESLSVGVCSVGRWTRQDCVSNGGQLVLVGFGRVFWLLRICS